LKKIQRVELWAEGALGKAHLEIQSISFEKASDLKKAPQSVNVRPSSPNDQCQDGV